MYWPDAIHDTTAKRQRKAAVLYGGGAGIVPRLYALSGQLYHVTVQLGVVNDWLHRAPKVARDKLGALMPDVPLYAVVAQSRAGETHIHALASLHPQHLEVLTSAHVWHRAVEHDKGLCNLVQYLCKPRDERACKPDKNDVCLYTPEQLRQQKCDAGEEYFQARLRGRLPRGSFTQNLPRLKPDPLSAPLPSKQAKTCKQLDWEDWTARKQVFWYGLSVFVSAMCGMHRLQKPCTACPCSSQPLPRARAPPICWRLLLARTAAKKSSADRLHTS